jgi:anti-sigma factor RsiW
MAAGHPETEIVPYLRGELPVADRDRVARHLDGCPHCRETADAVRDILEGLARSIPTAPDIHWGRYRAELRQKLEARGARAWWWRPLPLAASAALAGIVVVMAVQLTGRQGPPNGDLAAVEEALMGRRLEIVRQSGLLERLDLLEDLDVIRQLDELSTTRKG